MPFLSSQSVCVEDLAVRQTVEDYGNYRIVSDTTIPDIFALSEAERHALCDKLEAEQDASLALDLSAIDSKLLELSRKSPITPPPDHSADVARAFKLEAQSREALLDAGCPPCYPRHLEFPLQEVPEKYEVISYWQSLPGTGHVVLTAQLSDWRKSCDFQKRNRRYYIAQGTFPEFEDRVRDRRRRHGLEGGVCLLPDPEEQSRLQNWIEFQNYHLGLHEDEERKTKDERDELDAARKRLVTSGEAMGILEGRVKYGESKLEEHRKMLGWIEQRRKEMVAEQAASVHTAEDHDWLMNMPTTSSPGRRKRDQKFRSPLGPVWSPVSKKPSPRQRRLRPSKCDVPQSAENATAATKAPRRSKRIADLEDKSSRCDIESTPLRRPQSAARAKVAHVRKSRQTVSTRTNVNPRWQPTARSQHRKVPEQPSSRVTKRRSKRERREPQRFGFDPAREPCE